MSKKLCRNGACRNEQALKNKNVVASLTSMMNKKKLLEQLSANETVLVIICFICFF